MKKKILLSVFLILIASCLAYCSIPSYYYVDLEPGEGIPPDPGRWEGNSTILGVDSDNDGVRDDVQRWILATYPDDKNLRNVLMYVARSEQGLLKMPLDRKQIYTYMNDDTRYECVLFVNGFLYGYALQDLVMPKKKLNKVILNTPERKEAYWTRSNLGSGFYMSDKVNAENCKKLFGLEMQLDVQKSGESIPSGHDRWEDKGAVLGVDSDNDGVRDDVQWWILTTYPNNFKLRNILMYMARFHLELIEMPIEDKRKYLVLNDGAENTCVHTANGYFDRPRPFGLGEYKFAKSSLMEVILNTEERREAYWAGSHHDKFYMEEPFREITENTANSDLDWRYSRMRCVIRLVEKGILTVLLVGSTGSCRETRAFIHRSSINPRLWKSSGKSGYTFAFTCLLAPGNSVATKSIRKVRSYVCHP